MPKTHTRASDPFKALGISYGATAADVKTAFRRLSLATHPDRNPDADGADFRAAREAYERLTAPGGLARERRRYRPGYEIERDLWNKANAAPPREPQPSAERWARPIWTPPDQTIYPPVPVTEKDGRLDLGDMRPPPGWVPGDVPPEKAGCLYHVNGSAEARKAGDLEYGIWAVGIFPVSFVFGPAPKPSTWPPPPPPGAPTS